MKKISKLLKEYYAIYLFIDLSNDYQVGQCVLVLSCKNGSVFWDGTGILWRIFIERGLIMQRPQARRLLPCA